MKYLIFAGGSGKRFWPISRESLPKQFVPLFNNKSTFQLQYNRIRKIAKIEDIYISTNEKFVSIIKNQVPEIPLSNIFAEPEKKDLLAGLGYVLINFEKLKIKEPVTLLASDHLIKNEKIILEAFKEANQIILKNPNKLIFYTEKPLFPTNNLGWIHTGKVISKNKDFEIAEYKGWIYRPDIKLCEKMFKTGEWQWNINYESINIDFAIKKYKEHFPENYDLLQKIKNGLGTKNENLITKKYYSKLQEAHSDELWMKIKPEEAMVIKCNMGWSDPGTLYLLKKALEKKASENVTKGMVINFKTSDSLVYNYEPEKLVATMNLDGFVIVNTKDALLIAPKDHVRYLGDMLDKFKDTDLEKYL